MPVREITRGQRFRILAWGDDAYCEVLDFLEDLRRNSSHDAARLVYLIQRTVRHGAPENEHQCRPLGEGIFEFKAPSTARILWFYGAGHIIVCTHGFAGKRGRGRTPENEIKKAKDVRRQFLEEQYAKKN